VLERLPKIKRWHARLRRRLNTGSKVTKDAKWGRWLPENRLSIDQVPCNLREGTKSTYEEVGTTRVWIAGNKNDDGKRFCTLQIVARAANGSASEPRHGQPKIGLIFRGMGQRLSAEEKAAWHPDVHVKFQPKAWADADYCEKHAGVYTLGPKKPPSPSCECPNICKNHGFKVVEGKWYCTGCMDGCKCRRRNCCQDFDLNDCYHNRP
jgi:hypothetical protein